MSYIKEMASKYYDLYAYGNIKPLEQAIFHSKTSLDERVDMLVNNFDKEIEQSGKLISAKTRNKYVKAFKKLAKRDLKHPRDLNIG